MQQLLLVAMEDIYPLTKHLTAAQASCCWLSFILSIANTSSYLSDSGLDFTELNVWQDELISLLHRCSPSHHGAAKEHLTRVHAHTRTHTLTRTGFHLLWVPILWLSVVGTTLSWGFITVKKTLTGLSKNSSSYASLQKVKEPYIFWWICCYHVMWGHKKMPEHLTRGPDLNNIFIIYTRCH